MRCIVIRQTPSVKHQTTGLPPGCSTRRSDQLRSVLINFLTRKVPAANTYDANASEIHPEPNKKPAMLNGC